MLFRESFLSGNLSPLHCRVGTDERESSKAPVFHLRSGKRSSEMDQIISEMSQGIRMSETSEQTSEISDDLLALISDE